MPTVSTVPTFKAALLAALQARSGLTGVKVAYAWPGPSATAEMIAFAGSNTAAEIPAMQAGRKQRQEQYVTQLVIWVFKPGATPETSGDVEARAFEILGEVDDELADNVQTHDDIHSAVITRHAATFEPLDKGWAWQIVADITVKARLT